MVPISELYQLIKSLSGPEKRYLQLKAGGQMAGYWQLYHLLEPAGAYNEMVKAEVARLFPGKSIEPARKHLYKVIMTGLRQYDGGKEVETRLWELYHNSKLLLDKGLTKIAARQLEKGKALSETHEKLQFFSLFSRLQMEVIMRQQFADWEEMDIVVLQDENREMTEAAETIRRHAALYEILLCRYWKNGVVRSLKEQTRLNDLVLEEHQLVQKAAGSLKSRQLHLHFQSVYLLMTGDTEGGLQAFHELDQLFQGHSNLWAGNPLHYIHFLNDILQILRRQERFSEMDFFLHRLEALVPGYRSLQETIRLSVQEHKLHRALAQGAEAEVCRLLEAQRSSNEAASDHSSMQDRAQWEFTRARACMAIGKYAAALEIVNSILNLHRESLNRMLYSKYRMLNLLIHHRLGNQDYLYYELRALERKLKKGSAWFKTEKLVADALKNCIHNKPNLHFSVMLQQLQEDPYEQYMISELGLKMVLL